MAVIAVGNGQPNINPPLADLPRIDPPQADTCSICWEVLEPDDFRTTNCAHKFHLPCINKWVNEHQDNCPDCRAPSPLSRASLITQLNRSTPVIRFHRFVRFTWLTTSRLAHSIFNTSGLAIRNYLNRLQENKLTFTLTYIALSGCGYNTFFKTHEESFLTIFNLLGCAFLAKIIRAKCIQIKPFSLETKTIAYRVLPDAIHSLCLGILGGELAKIFNCPYILVNLLVGAISQYNFYSDAADKIIEPLSNKEVKIMDASCKSVQDIAADITSFGIAGALTGYLSGVGMGALITPSLILGGLYSMQEHLAPVVTALNEPERAPPELIEQPPRNLFVRMRQGMINIASEVFPGLNLRRREEQQRITYSPNLNKLSTWLTLSTLFVTSVAISYSIPQAFSNWSIIPLVGYPFYIRNLRNG